MSSIAYLKGVYDGDAFKDRKIIGLVCKSEFLAKNFQDALAKEGVHAKIRRITRSYTTPRNRQLKQTSAFYMIRKVIPETKFQEICNFQPKTNEEKISYIRGFYQSEGCYCNYKANYFYINMTNKNKAILEKIASFLKDLGINISGIYRQHEAQWERWKLYIYRQEEVKKFCKIIGERK